MTEEVRQWLTMVAMAFALVLMAFNQLRTVRDVIGLRREVSRLRGMVEDAKLPRPTSEEYRRARARHAATAYLQHNKSGGSAIVEIDFSFPTWLAVVDAIDAFDALKDHPVELRDGPEAEA